MLLSLLNPLTGVVFSFWGADVFHLCVMALVMHEQAGRAAPLQGNMLSKRNQSACRLKKKKKKLMKQTKSRINCYTHSCLLISLLKSCMTCLKADVQNMDNVRNSLDEFYIVFILLYRYFDYYVVWITSFLRICICSICEGNNPK